VVMATYQGAKYIKPQLDSIIPQLGSEDTLLISDDGSTDGTLEILQDYAADDERIMLLEGPHKGPAANFSFLLERACGDVVFLCDQDDIWLPGKLEKQLACFGPDVWLVLSDAKLIDRDGKVIHPSFAKKRSSGTGVLGTIWRNGFIGCCMAVSRPLLDIALPVPKGAPMHDMWLGVIAEQYKKVCRMEEPLVLYRRHRGAATAARASRLQQLIWRLSLIWELIKWRRH